MPFNLKKGVHAGVHLLNVVFLCTSKTMEAACPADSDTFSKVILSHLKCSGHEFSTLSHAVLCI